MAWVFSLIASLIYLNSLQGFLTLLIAGPAQQMDGVERCPSYLQAGKVGVVPASLLLS